jgi:hypothetical protein
LSVALLFACSSAPPRYPEPHHLPLGIEYAGRSGGNSPSASSADFSPGKGLSVPHRPRVTDSARLSVRPDRLRVGFAVREVAATPQAALQAARTKAESVAAELIEVTVPSTVSKLKGFTLARNTRDGKVVDISASVDGVIEVPLAANEDFWTRSQRYAAIVEAAERLATAYSGEDGLRVVSFETPEAQLSDPEPYRPELVKRWLDRTRLFAAAAQAETAPLVIRDCAPPGHVTQTSQSFDEVSLELTITCRIDIKSGAGDSVK